MPDRKIAAKRHSPPDRYEITIWFLEDGQINVQAEGVPYPLSLYNETGWELDRLLREAQDSITRDRDIVVRNA